MSFIATAWRGREKLWKVYWLYGVVGGIALSFLMGFLLPWLGTSGGFTYFAVLTLYSLWLWVSIWRCAFNANWKIGGYILRFLTVIGLAFTLLGIVGIALSGGSVRQIFTPMFHTPSSFSASALSEIFNHAPKRMLMNGVDSAVPLKTPSAVVRSTPVASIQQTSAAQMALATCQKRWLLMQRKKI